MVGCLLNLRKAALCRRIAFLQSSLNQGVLCLFEVEVFVIHSFASDINVSIKYFVWPLVLGSRKSFCPQRVSNTSNLPCLISNKEVFHNGEVVRFQEGWGSGRYHRDHHELFTRSPYRIKGGQWLSKNL